MINSLVPERGDFQEAQFSITILWLLLDIAIEMNGHARRVLLSTSQVMLARFFETQEIEIR